MQGNLCISFAPFNNGTMLTVDEQIIPKGVMKILSPIIGAAFRQTWTKRLQAIEEFLERKAEESTGDMTA